MLPKVREQFGIIELAAGPSDMLMSKVRTSRKQNVVCESPCQPCDSEPTPASASAQKFELASDPAAQPTTPKSMSKVGRMTPEQREALVRKMQEVKRAAGIAFGHGQHGS